MSTSHVYILHAAVQAGEARHPVHLCGGADDLIESIGAFLDMTGRAQPTTTQIMALAGGPHHPAFEQAMTELELTQAKIPYEVGKAFFKGMARAQIAVEPVGMLKILFHRETLEILGVHCFGYQASEIVHIGQAIMNQKGEANSIKYFVNTTFNYPTMAEAYRVAAFDGLNRLF